MPLSSFLWGQPVGLIRQKAVPERNLALARCSEYTFVVIQKNSCQFRRELTGVLNCSISTSRSFYTWTYAPFLCSFQLGQPMKGIPSLRFISIFSAPHIWQHSFFSEVISSSSSGSGSSSLMGAVICFSSSR